MAKRAKTKSAMELARQQVWQAVEEGWRLVYVDGSSKQPWKGSKHMARGFGIFSHVDSTFREEVQVLEPLPLNIEHRTDQQYGRTGGAGATSAVVSAMAEVGYCIGLLAYLIMGAQWKVQQWQWHGVGGVGGASTTCPFGRSCWKDQATMQGTPVDLR